MKLAILSDIHGNRLALEAVLKHAFHLKVDHYILLGDFIGYYHHPKEVIEMLKGIPNTSIQGNHEQILKDLISEHVSESEIVEKYGRGHLIALEQLSQDEITKLISLPKQKTIKLDQLKLLLCHGAPENPDRYIYPNIEADKLTQICSQKYDYIFIGHTHYPFVTTRGSCTLINVGSVGQSRDIGGLASWGLLDTTNNVYVSQRTPYNVGDLIAELKEMGYGNNDYLLKSLYRNRYDL